MESVRNKLIEILTILVILATFGFTTWRAEVSERNQNLRVAGFEILKNLGELQTVVNYAHYQADSMYGNPFLGWGYLALISDLSQLMPDPVAAEIQKLVQIWGEEVNNLKQSEAAATRVSHEVDVSRQTVLHSILALR